MTSTVASVRVLSTSLRVQFIEDCLSMSSELLVSNLSSFLLSLFKLIVELMLHSVFLTNTTRLRAARTFPLKEDMVLMFDLILQHRVCDAKLFSSLPI